VATLYGALAIKAERQIVYNFGDQHRWEFNAVPVVVHWQRFPWDPRFETAAAFGLGLSYATEVPEVEVEIEGESHQWLIYWVAELTAGPVGTTWGLMGDDGGMNAMGPGIRHRF